MRIDLLLGATTAFVTACGQPAQECAQLRACDTCTLEGCAWCFETGECIATTAICSGERALRPDQCDMEGRLVPDAAPPDAAVTAPVTLGNDG